MKHTMIVVADSTLARFFTAESAKSPLIEIKSMAHPEGRLHDRDITSDLPGRGANDSGTGKHSYEGKTDPKKHTLSEFASQIAAFLEDARNNNELPRLLLVAPPNMLGELRKNLSKETSKKIILEVDKNVTHLSAEEIREHLPQYLTH